MQICKSRIKKTILDVYYDLQISVRVNIQKNQNKAILIELEFLLRSFRKAKDLDAWALVKLMDFFQR